MCAAVHQHEGRRLYVRHGTTSSAAARLVAIEMPLAELAGELLPDVGHSACQLGEKLRPFHLKAAGQGLLVIAEQSVVRVIAQKAQAQACPGQKVVVVEQARVHVVSLDKTPDGTQGAGSA